MEFIAGKYNYRIYVALMMIGFYAMIAKGNLIKKIIGMNVFPDRGFPLLYLDRKSQGGTAPILWDRTVLYDNPVPQCTHPDGNCRLGEYHAVALALIILIYRNSDQEKMKS